MSVQTEARIPKIQSGIEELRKTSNEIHRTLKALLELNPNKDKGTNLNQWNSYKEEIEIEVKEKIARLLNNPAIKSSFTEPQIFKTLYSKILSSGYKDDDLLLFIIEKFENLNPEVFLTILKTKGHSFFIENDWIFSKFSNFDSIFFENLEIEGYRLNNELVSKFLENLNLFKTESILSFIEYLVKKGGTNINLVLSKIDYIKEYIPETDIMGIFLKPENIILIFRYSKDSFFSQIKFDSTFADTLIRQGNTSLIFDYKSDLFFKDIEFDSTFAEKLIENGQINLILYYKSEDIFSDFEINLDFLNKMIASGNARKILENILKLQDLPLEIAEGLLLDSKIDSESILLNLDRFQKIYHEQIIKLIIDRNDYGILTIMKKKLSMAYELNIEFNSDFLELVFKKGYGEFAIENLQIFQNLNFDNFMLMVNLNHNMYKLPFYEKISNNLAVFKNVFHNQIANFFIEKNSAKIVLDNLNKFTDFKLNNEHIKSIINTRAAKLLFEHREHFSFVKFDKELALELINNSDGYLIFEHRDEVTFNDLIFDSDLANLIISKNQGELVYLHRDLFQDFILDEDFLLSKDGLITSEIINNGSVPTSIFSELFLQKLINANYESSLIALLPFLKEVSLESGLKIINFGGRITNQNVVLKNINSFQESAWKELCLKLCESGDSGSVMYAKVNGRLSSIKFDINFMKCFMRSLDLLQSILDDNQFYLFEDIKPNKVFAELMIEMGYAEYVLRYKSETFFNDISLDRSLVEKIIKSGNGAIFETKRYTDMFSDFPNQTDFANLLIENGQANTLINIITQYSKNNREIVIDDLFLQRMITKGKLDLRSFAFNYPYLKELITSTKTHNIFEFFSQSLDIETPLKNVLIAHCLSINEEELPETFEFISNIFKNNHLPIFALRFKVFEYLFVSKHKTLRYTDDIKELPIIGILGHSSDKLKRYVVFRDLVKISVFSNDKNLRTYLEFLREGQDLINRFERGDNLSNSEIKYLDETLSKITTVYENSMISRGKKFGTDLESIESRINSLRQDLMVPEGTTISERLIQMFFKPFGVSNITQLLDLMDSKVGEAEQRNIDFSNLDQNTREEMVVNSLSHGTGINSFAYILEHGNYPGELVEHDQVDYTPLFVDLVEGNGIPLIQRASYNYGSLTLLYFNKGQYVRRDQNQSNRNAIRDLTTDTGIYELVDWAAVQNHVGIRTGLPPTEIGAIVVKSPLDYKRVCFSIANNGFYIPIVDDTGGVSFTYEHFLRYKVDTEYMHHILKSETFNPVMLVNLFSDNPFLDQQVRAQVTKMERFERVFANTDLSHTLFSRDLFRILLALRISYSKNSLRQRDFIESSKLNFTIISEPNYTSTDREILQNIATERALYEYFLGGSLEKATEKIRRLAKVTGTTVEKLYNTLKILYLLDATEFNYEMNLESESDIIESVYNGQSFLELPPKVSDKFSELERSLGINT